MDVVACVNSVYYENIFVEEISEGVMELLVMEVTDTLEDISLQSGSNKLQLFGYLDSGANVSIMTTKLFKSFNFVNLFQKYESPRRIYTAKEGHFMLSIGRVTVGGLLRTMELVPEASHNLLSTAVITRTNGVVISQYGSTCEIKFPDGTTKKYSRNEQSNLYPIAIDDIIDKSITNEPTMEACPAHKVARQPIPKRLSRPEAVSIRNSVTHLHKCACHRNLPILAAAVKAGAIVNSEVTPTQIIQVSKHCDCAACALAKWKEPAKDQGLGHLVSPAPLHTLSVDIQGPFSVGIGGYYYWITFVCLATGKPIGFCVKVNDAATLIKCTDTVILYTKTYRFINQRIRFDAGKVEGSDAYKSYLALKHIETLPASPEQQQLNPVERAIQDIKNSVSAMLMDQQVLPASFWPLAYKHFLDTMSLLPNSACGPDTTPDYVIMKVTTDCNRCLRFYFGQEVVTRKLGKKPSMPESRNEYGIVVGQGDPRTGATPVYLPSHPGSYWKPAIRHVIHPLVLADKPILTLESGRDILPVVTNEGVFIFKSGADMRATRQGIAAPPVEIPVFEDTSILPEGEDSVVPLSELVGPESEPGTVRRSARLQRTPAEESVCFNLIAQSNDGSSQLYSFSLSEDIFCTINLSDIFENVEEIKMACFQAIEEEECLDVSQLMIDVSEQLQVLAAFKKGYDPRRPTPEQALAHWNPNRLKWIQAMNDHRQLLNEREQFWPERYQLSQLPVGVKPIPTMWVLHHKDNDKYKGRLVGRDSKNNRSYDGETYSPVASKIVLWLIHSIGALLKLYSKTYDITGAYPTAETKRDIYVKFDGEIRKLRRCLNGIVDAGREYNEDVSAHLQAGGYVMSAWDRCLFIKWISLLSFIYIVMYVDDFKVKSNDTKLITEFEQHMDTKYDMTTNDDGMYLGILEQVLPDGSTCYSKPHIESKLYDEYVPKDFTGPHPAKPMVKSYSKNRPSNSPLCDNSKFRSLLGLLMQLIDVKLELNFPLSKISRYTETAIQYDFDALLHMVFYLHGTQHIKLVLRTNNDVTATYIQLRSFADMAYSSHNGKSQYCTCYDLVTTTPEIAESGDYVDYGTAMFHLRSTLAKTVDLGTCCAEIGTNIEAGKDDILLRGVLEELGHKQLFATPIYNDNTAAIKLGTDY